MKYPEPKDITVTLLRQAVAQMGQHDAALNPLTFAVFYEHVAGVNPRLTEAITAAMADSPRLPDETVRQLHVAHVADVGADAADRIRGDIGRVMTAVSQSAERTGQVAGAFDVQLHGLQGALGGGDIQALAPHLDAARAGTAEMRQAVAELQQQVDSGRKEIERLRDDLVRARQQATLCPLTRVLNRRGFDERLQAMLAEPPPRGAEHCLVLLDIDHFKRVNDTFGHLIGDRVIEGLGAVLRSVPAEPGMACARYGGEEFAILLPATTLTRAVQIAETTRQRAHGLRINSKGSKDGPLTVTLSAGVAAWRPGEDASQFVSCADAALYRSKASGRDRVTVA